MTVSSLGSYAVGGYQPPNPSKILTKLYDELEATGASSTASSSETTPASTTTTGQSSGSSTGQLSDSIMSLLFHMQAQESGVGQPPPPPPADNENGPKQGVSEFFSSIDSDGDGNVSQTELGSFLQAQGGSEDDAAKIFSALDSDGNGSVSEDELAQSVERGRPQRAEHRPPPSSADLAEKLFGEIDSDGNGTLTKTEMEEFVKSSGGTTEQADELFTSLDTEGTGSVTKDQLLAAAEELEANKPNRPDPATWSRYSDALATATKSSASVAVAA